MFGVNESHFEWVKNKSEIIKIKSDLFEIKSRLVLTIRDSLFRANEMCGQVVALGKFITLCLPPLRPSRCGVS